MGQCSHWTPYRGDTWCNGWHVCFPCLPPMLLCWFESRSGLEFSGFSMWHFLKLDVRGFLRVLRFPPLLHRLMVSAHKVRLNSILSNVIAELSLRTKCHTTCSEGALRSHRASPPRNLPLWSQNVPSGVPNTISLVPRTDIMMHWSYNPLRKGTLLCSPGH